ncbi:Uracil-DNA glycosylase [Acropora cervicornis]|uniref:Uracil-DNA glycosylase n=1 Tax=Acropora cervicornis TaxID=6130 RepID=A0AAD9R4T1_ACRCE|nr:Uracil-DNA glycosylase [Acropora cervicornis]
MSNQMRISNFFNTSATKRRASDVDATSDSPQMKSPKTVDESSPESNAKRPLLNLSPEQRERMEANRKEAEKRLLANKRPQFFGASWRKALAAEFGKEYFVKLTNFVKEERLHKTVYPTEKDVYSWTLQCEIHEIKVVIIGQDPYHGPRQAHGLCFSVLPGVAIPPSLVNIYKELANDIDDFQIPKHGYLKGWAKQGVLLLNACLTVVASKANSHKDKGWEQFTDAVIRWINSNLTGVVFLLWGAYAQKKGSFIDKKKHCVLKAVHPSPLSAHRGFLGCKHFSQANDYLKKVGKKAVNWCSLPLDKNEAFST